MQNFTTKSEKELSPIGIGTWGIGGRGHRDMELTNVKEDQVYIDALINQFNTGYNFSEMSLGYGNGRTAELFSKALKESGINREDLFLTNSLYPRDLTDFSVLEDDTEKMYEIFNTDYFDSTLVTQSLLMKFGYETVVEKLWKLLKEGKTRYISLSNSNKEMIKKIKEEFEDKMFAHETHISFEIRGCQDEGIFDLTDELGIQTVIWRPLRQNMTSIHNWELLEKLSKKYGKTQNQIILNWINSLGFKPEVFSTTEEHIKENWKSMQFKMEQSEYDEITKFRVPGYVPPKIDWSNIGLGDSIVPPIMGFEENYKFTK